MGQLYKKKSLPSNSSAHEVFSIDRGQAIAHLEALGYKHGEIVYLRAIPGKGYEGEEVLNLEAKFPNLPWSRLEQLQRERKGIYFVVNGGGHRDLNVKHGKALFCEFDDRPIEDQLLFWENLKLPEPTLQIATRKSVHSYWVFDEPIALEKWKELQKDFLAFTGSDPRLCNPSRVLRLAGCWHIKAGAEPIKCDTVSCQPLRNNPTDLLQIIVKTGIKEENNKPSQYQYSLGDDVPLYQCLSKSDRLLIDAGLPESGGPDGGRNASGAKLARNLIGTAQRLQYLGYCYEGDPRQLFDDYCQRCTPPLEPKEAEKIWRSAEKDNPTSTLGDDALENCVKAWQRQQSKATGKGFAGNDLHKTSQKATRFEEKVSDPDERLRLDLLALLKESDPIKRTRKRAEICSNYRLSKAEVEDLLKVLSRRTEQKQTKVYDLDELFALESEGLQWLIPELLPKGETIILAGSPKAGKTLLAIDAAFAIATEENSFLGETTQRGKVLLVSCDESLNSTKSKLIKRGFRAADKEYIRILPQWTIDDLDSLEAQLEDFRPDVVVIDSLRRINHGSQISENSAEFADNIYTLKETIARYGASGILIHHTNKDKDAMGVGKLRGSSAIAGAVWGTWQLDHIPKPDPNNAKKLIIDPKDPRRVLSVFARDTEGQSLGIEFNPEDNSWLRLDEDTQSEQQTVRERIVSILLKNSHVDGLSGKQIIELLGMTPEEGRGVYTELNRMVNKRLISCKPASGDKRVSLYSLPLSQQNTQQAGDSPPPPPTEKVVEYMAKTIDLHSVSNTQQNTQQLLNNYSTTLDADNPVEYLKASSSNASGDTQQLFQKRGGEGVPSVVEPSQYENKKILSADIQKEVSVDDVQNKVVELSFDPAANAELMLEALEDDNAGEMLATLVDCWTDEQKSEVRMHLQPSQVDAIRTVLRQYRVSAQNVPPAQQTADEPAVSSKPAAITPGLRVRVVMPGSKRDGKVGTVKTINGRLARVHLDDSALGKLRWFECFIPGTDLCRLEII
jgi:KaiC/GvpD/RAD55 family RecA-like ATPase